MAKEKMVTLAKLMSKFGIKAAELSELFGVTRQTIYNNREKNLINLTKENQNRVCELCSVTSTLEVVKFYNEAVAADGKALLKKNMALLLQGKKTTSTTPNVGKTIELTASVSEEYCRLLEKLLKDRLAKGDDFDLLKLISNR